MSKNKPTCRQIASDWTLWCEYTGEQGLVPQARSAFSRRSLESKIKQLHIYDPDCSCENEEAV